jgi:hypothetical protein
MYEISIVDVCVCLKSVWWTVRGCKRQQGRKVNGPVVVDIISIDSVDKELLDMLFMNQKV